MDIKELAAKSIAQVKAAAEELSRLKGFKLKSLTGLINIVKLVVKNVEEVGLAEGIKGADKQSLACELILQVVPLPGYVMYFVRPLLPILVDIIVDALKDKFGK